VLAIHRVVSLGDVAGETADEDVGVLTGCHRQDKLYYPDLRCQQLRRAGRHRRKCAMWHFHLATSVEVMGERQDTMTPRPEGENHFDPL
jgi:hypothetical protein